MADETTSSVSKGCFVFKKPKITSPRRKRRSSCTAEEVLEPVHGEPPEHFHLRLRNYDECWGCMKTKIQNLQSNTEIFSQLLGFIKNAHKAKGFSQDCSHRHDGKIKEIPTAAFITGVNMPDHEVIFSELSRELKAQVSPYVALLHSKDCAAMKMIVKNVIVQLMGSEQCQDEDDDELNTSQTGKKLRNFTMQALCHWYRQIKRENQSQKRKSVQYSDCLPLVIVFEDFEGFVATVIQDFILILSQYIWELPIVLVFGIATSVTAVHRVLPHAVSTRLAMEKFQTQPSHTVLLEMMSEVLITARFPFKISASVFRFLYENFLYHDFSLQNFARGLQICMMEHFSSNPISVLCCLEMNQRIRTTSELTSEQLELCRQTMSFRRYVEGQEPQAQCRLLRNDEYTKGTIMLMLQELEEYHWCFFPVLHCLHGMTSNLPRHPLGRKVRDVYELSLTSNIYEMEEYKEAITLLRVYARDELVPLVQKCVDILIAALEDLQGMAGHCQKLKKPRDTLSSLLKQFDKLSERIEDEDTGTSSQKISVLPKVANRFELQERLRTAAKQKRKDSPYDQVRQETIQYLDELFRQFLQCPRYLPLNEVMYYDSVTEVKQRMVGMPRVAIQTALSNPQYYLKCKCCPNDIGTIQDTMPDISVAYKLHLECGRLINLFDWLQAFTVVLEPETAGSGKRSPKKMKKSDEELQARFIRAVSELQFLGFIKSTKRKTDHVQRLTWGGC